MKIEFLDTVFSACNTLRQIQTLTLEEKKRQYKLRPQLHPMVISPFGTSKSSISKMLKEMYPKNFLFIDNFTKASIEGSISKDGDYVPSLLTRLGGKVLVIDEWNNLDTYSQQSLLGVLENQKICRTLGFRVKRKFEFKDKWGKFTVTDNMIEGETIFGCIAYAMEYPFYEKNQAEKALLSRYSPLFIEPTKEMINAITSGDFIINVDDYSSKTRHITVAQDTYYKVHDKFYEYIEHRNLFPQRPEEFGYITRAWSDFIRLGVYNYMKRVQPNDKDITIDSPIYFTEMFDFVYTILLQYQNPQTTNKLFQYKRILEVEKDSSPEHYAKVLGVSTEAIELYDRKLGRL